MGGVGAPFAAELPGSAPGTTVSGTGSHGSSVRAAFVLLDPLKDVSVRDVHAAGKRVVAAGEPTVDMAELNDVAVEFGITHRAKALATTGLVLTVIPEVSASPRPRAAWRPGPGPACAGPAPAWSQRACRGPGPRPRIPRDCWTWPRRNQFPCFRRQCRSGLPGPRFPTVRPATACNSTGGGGGASLSTWPQVDRPPGSRSRQRSGPPNRGRCAPSTRRPLPGRLVMCRASTVTCALWTYSAKRARP